MRADDEPADATGELRPTRPAELADATVQFRAVGPPADCGGELSDATVQFRAVSPPADAVGELSDATMQFRAVSLLADATMPFRVVSQPADRRTAWPTSTVTRGKPNSGADPLHPGRHEAS